MASFSSKQQYLGQTLILAGLMMFVFGFDQYIKNAAQLNLSLNQPLPVIPNVLQWTLTYNTGAAFSLFKQNPQLLTSLTGIIFLGLSIFSLIKKLTLQQSVCIGFILGGALGNLYDRLTLGKVVDFIDVTIINYPIFNVADSFIFIGVVGLILQQFSETMHTGDSIND